MEGLISTSIIVIKIAESALKLNTALCLKEWPHLLSLPPGWAYTGQCEARFLAHTQLEPGWRVWIGPQPQLFAIQGPELPQHCPNQKARAQHPSGHGPQAPTNQSQGELPQCHTQVQGLYWVLVQRPGREQTPPQPQQEGNTCHSIIINFT